MKKTVRFPLDSLSTPRISDFPMGPTYLFSRLHDCLDAFGGILRLFPTGSLFRLWHLSCRFPATPWTLQGASKTFHLQELPFLLQLQPIIGCGSCQQKVFRLVRQSKCNIRCPHQCLLQPSTKSPSCFFAFVSVASYWFSRRSRLLRAASMNSLSFS